MSSRGRGRGGGGRGRGTTRTTAPASKTLTQEWYDALGGKKKGQEFASLLARVEQDGVGKTTGELCVEIRTMFYNFTRGRTIDGEVLESSGVAKKKDSVGVVSNRHAPAVIIKRVVDCITGMDAD